MKDAKPRKTGSAATPEASRIAREIADDSDLRTRTLALAAALFGNLHSVEERREIRAALLSYGKAERERCAAAVAGNGRLCRELAAKLADNGAHAMAEMQRIRAEQCEGLAAAIRAIKEE